MNTNTVIKFHEVGEPEVLQYEQEAIKRPKNGEIRIKVEAIGVGFGECLYRRGWYIQETVLGGSLGNNAVGIVDAIGPDVTNVNVGQKISLIPSFQMNEFTVYSEYAIVPAFSAAPYFDSLSIEENASIWMQVSTAYGALIHYGNIDHSDTVLIHPSSGGVGIAAIQTAKKVGARVIATTRNPDKVNSLLDYGADHVIVTSTESISDGVNRITKDIGVSLVFNAMTGNVLNELVEVTKPGGRVIQYGGIGGEDTPLPFASVIGKGITIQGYTLYELTYEPSNLEKVISFVKEGVESGIYTANVGRVFDFSDMVNVHKYLEAGDMAGSVVVRVG
ncbi:zinc-dependent alcohol dehydrogenase family protein [Marinibactrum halimedae]|uniref:NADPH:quinone reductase n=1 Tax=Marinibactrum halimedae TaxID=1444977 RepID=A0AA37T7H7_9GAMM|nr:zinc-dependent alcohol dehydrogenase family protein [Marinibactrum halimedae]MCD9461155.1 zinc-dependent alcohol dehydrogenase family protein [Marinibactrum halimedae]GLS26042.1 NADPH:quinone reductase [Marinibactrum halimedae]